MADMPLLDVNMLSRVSLQPGDYAVVKVTQAKGHTLRGRLLWRTSITAFDQTGLSGKDVESLQRAAVLKDMLGSAEELQTFVG